MSSLSGISESNRALLTTLHRHAHELVDVEEAARLLKIDRVPAAKLLAQLAAQGWLRRIRRGLYLLIPLEATSSEDWSGDPWQIAARVYEPCYIAGWSACGHWGFTEQIFRDVAVFTAAAIHGRHEKIDQTTYALRKVAKRSLFGTRSIWRNEARVPVSDPTRTLIDILDEPKWGGGIRHVTHIIEAYWSSEHRDETQLIDYAQKLGNAAVVKRMGYLLETLHMGDETLIDRLHRSITTGYARLDPSVPARGSFITRWNLQINVDVSK